MATPTDLAVRLDRNLSELQMIVADINAMAKKRPKTQYLQDASTKAVKGANILEKALDALVHGRR